MFHLHLQHKKSFALIPAVLSLFALDKPGPGDGASIFKTSLNLSTVPTVKSVKAHLCKILRSSYVATSNTVSFDPSP